METHSAARVTTPPRRRWVLWVGIASLEVLLMGAAFVGGRLLAEQNLRTVRPPFAVQLPAQLPKEPAAGSGIVQKIQGQVLTLGRTSFGRREGQVVIGGPGAPDTIIGGPGAPDTSSQTEVVVTPETKFYKSVASGPAGNQRMPSGGQAQSQAEEASLTDVKVGNMVMVWGPKSGERITAEVIYIQSLGR